MTIIQTLKVKGRQAGAVWLACALIRTSLPLNALAQQSQNEPEANPQFQNQLNSQSSQGGSPLTPGASPQPQAQAAPDLQAAPTPSSYSEQPPEAPALDSESEGGRSKKSRSHRSAPTSPMESPVTLRVHDVPVAVFLDSISSQANINFILAQGLESRKVTAFLQNVTVRDALQVLLEINNLTYRRVGETNTYLVTPRSQAATPVITRIYTLSYIPLVNIGSAQQLQSSLAPTSNVGGSTNMSMSGMGGAASGGGNGYGTSGGNGGVMESSSGSAPQGSQGAPGAQSGPPIVNVIQSVLSRQGHIAADSRTNSLIITDIPDVFPQIEQIIAELDKKAPQIMIEAQIVEIDSSKANDLGIEWGGANGELATFTGGQRDTTFPMILSNNLSNTRFFDPVTNIISSLGTAAASTLNGSASTTGNSAASNVSLVGSAVQTSVLNLTQLTVILRALVEKSEARFLGKPKILTLNSQPALIQIATDQATSVQTSIASGGSTGVSVTGATVERSQTGLVMSVTPQVNKDGYITMLVRPSFTNVQQSSLSSASHPVFDPVSRAATSLVRVKNGQTLVLGGLLESNETKTVRKVPLLGYIPIIGWFFTSTQSLKTNSDLVIFLTPTIISD